MDESGKPERSHKSQLFVQAAFILLDDEWQAVDNSVDTLKTKWFPNLAPTDIEIHAWEIINQKGPYRTLGRTNSLQFLTEVFDLISQTSCTLVASVIHKNRIFSRLTDDDIDLWSHRLLFERICKFLEKDNNRKIAANQSTHKGILLIDFITQSYNNKIRRKYRRFSKHGTYYLQNKYLIEDPLFVDSQYRNMSQLVDIVAHLLNRHTNLRNKLTASWNDVDYVIDQGYRTIFSKFDTDSSGKVLGCGIKHFP